jgi:DNA-binding transcriptional LysR family regulator
LREPADLAGELLLRSYRSDEWVRWFAAAGVACPVVRGAVFDSSLTMAEAAAQGAGVALAAGEPVRARTARGAPGRGGDRGHFAAWKLKTAATG